jgi:hemoglobin
MNRFLMRTCLVLTALWFATPARAADDELFRALGGMPGITKIVDDVIEISVANPAIKETFDNINFVRLKAHIVDQLCELTGGPCVYKGRTMYKSHYGLHLTTRDFNAFVEDLQRALDRSNIPFRTQNRLLAILAPMHRDIITR